MRLSSMRINLMWVGAAIAVVLIGLFIFAGRNGPTSTAQEFLEALGKGDSAKLTELSLIRRGDKESMRKAYDFATQEAGKNYSFWFRIKDEHDADANTANVQISVIRNATKMTSYEENFEIPLIRENGKWLVDVGGISTQMYPALPR